MVQKYRVKRFFDDRGFGFLRGDKNGDLFFHMSGKHRATATGNEVRYARTRDGRAPEEGEEIIVLETTEISGKKQASKWCFAGQADEVAMEIEFSLPITRKGGDKPPMPLTTACAALDMCVRNQTHQEVTRITRINTGGGRTRWGRVTEGVWRAEWKFNGRIVASGMHGHSIRINETANFAATNFDSKSLYERHQKDGEYVELPPIDMTALEDEYDV
jgi:cold shock CspA family protein